MSSARSRSGVFFGWKDRKTPAKNVEPQEQEPNRPRFEARALAESWCDSTQQAQQAEATALQSVQTPGQQKPPHPDARPGALSRDSPSVDSNLKRLSMEDGQETVLLNSTSGVRGMKRAAEDTETRPAKQYSVPYEDRDTEMAAAPASTSTPPPPPPPRHTYLPPSKSPSTSLSPPQAHILEQAFASSPESSPNEDLAQKDGSIMFKQPETRPITQEQLVNEVKGIYAGLVMVEKKCVEIDQQQSKTTNKLADEQWQALIALHRTLLYEHHDFFLASQHPSSSAALRRLATKYAMPARMWRHGIHSFLELLRHRLPDSLDHMLAFVYLAYSMMALLVESVPSFEETWIECLGDLARYRMAIEEVDMRDREIWSGVARMWYNKAADKSPNVGRIQHHLAVLARPNIVQQLFYYSKALVSVIPFQNARESVMLLFGPFLEDAEMTSKYPPVEAALVKCHALLFTLGSIGAYHSLAEEFLTGLDNHIGRSGAKFRTQGPEMALAWCAATFAFGQPEAFLSQRFQDYENEHKARATVNQTPGGQQIPALVDPKLKQAYMREYWFLTSQDDSRLVRANPYATADATTKDAKFSGAHDAAENAVGTLGQVISIVSQRIGDKNAVAFMHTILAYLWSLSHVPGSLPYVEGHVPWESLSAFLNTMGRSGVDEARVVSPDFPQPLSGTGRQLPEDFPMRGLRWAEHYFPESFFKGQIVDDDERTLELPSHAGPRAERCLWLGVRLASIERWLIYNRETSQFATTEFARSLAGDARARSSDNRSPTLSMERDMDTQMVDVRS